MKKLILFLLFIFTISIKNNIQINADEIVNDEYKIINYEGQQNFSYFIDQNNILYATGSNASGQLGIGTIKNETRINPVKVMENVKIVRSGKSGFGIILTLSGELYSFGNNQFAQLGLGTTFNNDSQTNCVSLPSLIDLDRKIKIIDIVCGAQHSLLLTEAGEVYSFGSNLTGQLGLGLETSRKTTVGKPTKIDQAYFNNELIVQIASTEFTSFALSENGNVYAFGENDKGLICNNDSDFNNYYNIPAKTLLENIKKISAKSTTAMALTNDNKVYIWGNNTFRQFGISDYTENYSQIPLEIKKYYSLDGSLNEIKIKDICCGGITNFILSENGDIYAFGSGGNGQVGFDILDSSLQENPLIEGSNVIVPTKIEFYQPINIKEKIDNGDDAYKGLIPVDKTQKIEVEIKEIISSIGTRTFIKDNLGNIWSFGSNADGLAGSGNVVNCIVPVRTTLYRVENYDKSVTQKNYLIKPIITLIIVFGLAAVWLISTEIKGYNMRKRINKN